MLLKFHFQKNVVILKITGDTIPVNTYKHRTNIICKHLKMLKLECKKTYFMGSLFPKYVELLKRTENVAKTCKLIAEFLNRRRYPVGVFSASV